MDDSVNEFLSDAMSKGDVDTKRALASSGYFHDTLKDYCNEDVRLCVAQCSKDMPTLHYLSADPSEKVRVTAMLNPHHGQGTLF